ncbi:hypothetical protein MJO29_008106 [Puccinia striiformis f. sp. tritici]|nr:hypothetical protein Pst134EB_016837 [Puccinia striiformis f. sp. tritici]KAI7952475.1 hypothetical protein MJO29_008106 [Puccinia striiformis f. sp. tritici]
MSLLRWIGVNNQQQNNSSDTQPVNQWWAGSDEKYFGMENFGNTCYANSVLQALYFCKPFRQLLELSSQDSDFLLAASPLNDHKSSATHIRSKSTSFGPNSSITATTRPRSKSNQLHFPKSEPSNHTKRNWAAADFDQAGLGKHDPAKNQEPSSGSDDYPTICSSLRDLFRHISAQPTTVGAVAPQAFITTVKRYNELFRSTMHQDAHEFLNYLVNSVAEDVLKEQENKRQRDQQSSLLEPTPPSLQDPDPSTTNPITPNTLLTQPTSSSTWVHKLFEGILTNETKCLTCETVTQRDESFLDLSINIHQNTSLTACLRQFSASEMLCQKNKFSCDQCCGLQEAEKRMKIKKLPNILALHLKRFKYQENLQRYTKLSYRVVFPFELKLFNTTDDIQNPDRLYELWAIVVHIGAGPHHGHYVTILKSNGHWLLFDDNVVTRIEERDIEKYYGDTPGVGSGYVLFYHATDLNLMDMMGVPSEPDEVEEDSEAGTEDSEDEIVIPAIDDSTLNTMYSARTSPTSLKLKQELPQLTTWNGFQPASSSSPDPFQKNSVPFSSSCLSSSSPASSYPLQSTSQQQQQQSNSPLSSKTLATSDRYELSTATGKAELTSPQSGERRSHESKTSRLSRSLSTSTMLSSLSRSLSGGKPKPIDVQSSPQSSPDPGLLSAFQTGPPLPKSGAMSPPIRTTIPNLPSPKMNDEPPVTRSIMAGNYSPTSPLIPPCLLAGNSSPRKPLSSPITSNASSSSTPNLHRKFSAKFLRRKKSSATKTTDSTPHSSPTIAGGGKDAPSSSTSAYQHHHHQPVSSSPLGPDHQFERPKQSFSPRPIQASNQYSLSNGLNPPQPPLVSLGNSPSSSSTCTSNNVKNGINSNSLPSSNRNSIHSIFHFNHHQLPPPTQQQDHHHHQQQDSTSSSNGLIPTKGAQAPPATSILTNKQQKQIKKASQKADKLAVKNKLKAIKDLRTFHSHHNSLDQTSPAFGFSSSTSTTSLNSSPTKTNYKLSSQFKFSSNKPRSSSTTTTNNKQLIQNDNSPTTESDQNQSGSPRINLISSLIVDNSLVNEGPSKPTPSPTEFKRSTPNPTPHSVLLTSSSVDHLRHPDHLLPSSSNPISNILHSHQTKQNHSSSRPSESLSSSSVTTTTNPPASHRTSFTDFLRRKSSSDNSSS